MNDTMTIEEAIEILRDTPIDIRSTREDDILTLYATAHDMAIDALLKADAAQKLREMPRYLNGVKANQIKKIPSEAVQVVRCNDCKWHFNGHLCKQLSQYGSIETPPSFYCGFGERREP